MLQRMIYYLMHICSIFLLRGTGTKPDTVQ
uniref:Uncharacterized protein n=1 Tax=Rhizophora mucronata TaxID=61149 RepID=A0A2P2PYG9_RHIMU